LSKAAGILEAGRIVKACGLKGRMKVLSYLESNDILQFLKEIAIRRDGKVETFKLKHIGSKGTCFFLEVDGIADMESASALVGSEVLIPEHILEELPEGEYYWHDLIGLDVVTEDGCFIGKIETVFPTGSNDVYVCAGGEREILLPGIADVVREIDMGKGQMVVRLLEGL
jgi:16S rRNA processing protein RimM